MCVFFFHTARKSQKITTVLQKREQVVADEFCVKLEKLTTPIEKT